MLFQLTSLLARCAGSFRLYAFANSRNTERQGWPQATAQLLGLDATYAPHSAPLWAERLWREAFRSTHPPATSHTSRKRKGSAQTEPKKFYSAASNYNSTSITHA